MSATPPSLRPEFWRLPLSELTREEWEALCDRCGRCCLVKLEDEDTEELIYTRVHCKLYDPSTCGCRNYPMRRTLVPGCVGLTPETLEDARQWMPSTCAYRLLAQGDPLPDWHPLITGDPGSTRKAGMAMDGRNKPGRLVAEQDVPEEDLEDYALKRPL